MPTTYKIGEAAALLNLKTYVLRFWETEFPDIAPLRTEKGQRLYTEEHLALLERVRYLLHERGLTIGGARKMLEEEKARGVAYVFGMPAALSRPADWSPDSPGAPPDAPAMPAGDAEKALASSPQFQKLAEAVAAVLDRADSDAPSPLPPRPHNRLGRHGQPSQYDLPGLGELAACRISALDNPPGRGYGPEKDGVAAPPDRENPPPEQPCGGGDEGMLPLFAVAKAAFLAGKASGGDNFIQTGAVSLTRPVAKDAAAGRTAPAPGRGPEAAAGAPGFLATRRDRSRECLRDMLEELESLAELLRRKDG